MILYDIILATARNDEHDVHLAYASMCGCRKRPQRVAVQVHKSLWDFKAHSKVRKRVCRV